MLINIDDHIAQLKAHVVELRRILHHIPEPGLHEVETTRFILNYLQSLGMEARLAAPGTGVIAYMKGTGEKTVAFRADIDALSVEEQTGLAYRSTKPGFMHACGHDGHMAILLGLAKFLSESKNELKHNILFIFQPAEEGPGGAEPIVKSGILKEYNVQCIFGLHIYPDIEEGKIGSREGAMMAQTGEFDIRITGKSGHGAMPHKGTDAMVAAAEMVMALNTVISRNVDPVEPAILTVGRLQSGERRNVIAGDAVLEGTMRAFNHETYSIIRGRLVKIVEATAAANDCTVNCEIRDMYPAVTNDSALFGKLRDLIAPDDFIHLKPLTISEDFSYYQKEVPGLFFMLGSRNEAMNCHFPLHNNRFNFNEDIMLIGMQTLYNLLLSLDSAD